jgi:hypothetical protein
MRLAVIASLLLLPVLAWAQPSAEPKPAIQAEHDEQAGQLRLLIDGREALVYQHSPELDLPHYYPVRSPSGEPMTVQQTEPYPHHRSFWFADRVQLQGQRIVGFYDALYTREDKNDPKSPLRDHIRHTAQSPLDIQGREARFTTDLVWEMDRGKTPVLDEHRDVRLVALDGGEYFLDITFTLTAKYGDVAFLSDAVHYAWPFLRMNKTYSVESGGKIVNSEGGVNQAGTNMKPARWVDYSNTVKGQAEGLAVFSHPANEHPHAWLTRDYGCFGPRRIDAKSGKPFTLKQSETTGQRVGVLVHRGDVESGQVPQRYEAWAEGKL